MTVDPKVHALAEAFVARLFAETTLGTQPIMKAVYDTWVARAAQAMQRAIEDECTEIRRELMT